MSANRHVVRLLALLLLLTSAQGVAAQGTPVGGAVREIKLSDLGSPISMSPNGAYLVVESSSEGLCVYDTETMEQISCGDLSGLNSGIRNGEVVWSPDSTRLAFGEIAFRHLKDSDLWVMDARSGVVTKLTDEQENERNQDDADTRELLVDISPAWTPDGQFITFSRSAYKGSELLENVIAQVPAAGGDVETLALVSLEEMAYQYRAAWSPDGTSFYYTVTYLHPDNPDNGIWVLNKATGQTRQLTKADDAEQGPLSLEEVSPAGDRLLAVYSMNDAKRDADNPSLLRFVDPETGALSPVPDPPPDSETYDGTSIATFSPDGHYLLQAVGQEDGIRDFWVTNLSTGESTVVATGLEDAISVEYGLGPVWGSNGLVFVAHTVVGAYFFSIEGAGTVDLKAHNT